MQITLQELLKLLNEITEQNGYGQIKTITLTNQNSQLARELTIENIISLHSQRINQKM